MSWYCTDDKNFAHRHASRRSKTSLAVEATLDVTSVDSLPPHELKTLLETTILRNQTFGELSVNPATVRVGNLPQCMYHDTIDGTHFIIVQIWFYPSHRYLIFAIDRKFLQAKSQIFCSAICVHEYAPFLVDSTQRDEDCRYGYGLWSQNGWYWIRTNTIQRLDQETNATFHRLGRSTIVVGLRNEVNMSHVVFWVNYDLLI